MVVTTTEVQTAPFPILTCANYNKLHISDDGQRTRCGRNCAQWGSEDDIFDSVEKCPRCGGENDFIAVHNITQLRNSEREAKRQEENQQSLLLHSARRTERRRIEAIIRDALREAGYEVLFEQLPAGVNTFVFAQTEFEEVGFQINANEATTVANRVRGRK